MKGKFPMHCQMYSLKEFSIELRTHFRLPTYPYDEDEARANLSLEYLRQYGVFFFRDDEHGHGVIIPPVDDLNIIDRSGFIAYRSMCELEFDTEDYADDEWQEIYDAFENVGVTGWEKPTKKYVEKKGDDRAWLEFNRQVMIVTFNEEIVRLG